MIIKIVILLPTCVWGMDFPSEYTKFNLLNKDPLIMDPHAAELCRSVADVMGNPHSKSYMNIYVNGNVLSMDKAALKFPIGSIIVKEKLDDDYAKRIITVMEKVESNGKPTDWKYLIYSLNNNSGNLTRPGTAQSCIECHEKFEYDYISDRFKQIRWPEK